MPALAEVAPAYTETLQLVYSRPRSKSEKERLAGIHVSWIAGSPSASRLWRRAADAAT
ncbi:hypothetical protein XAC3810_280004 [Xanthomonas citri pv. citri]|uniref:Uncharacterized protein n=1 Tax=Xanthomonas citri pv. citri TaxID=611301 RepID=A0A0U5FGD4_XANCI|nr:hypothetical protein XAC3824_280055 [Xanthomonas citri pv. citri]CEE24378.1 hypothetical protein XAC1083_270004 [Xanthomonas citri pv. citri]CEE32770.1 hypothetical protein XAC3810_280004 [Xanthomonas citri pv. citri]CEE35063.1 hypothetical protein XAC902_330106 [Xanthomonas citri pv. citri]CEE35416.1 hypothetical protein XAC2911_250187 [Xanthomonas citri pv. citri]